MVIKISNEKLNKVYDLLQGIPLKAKQSRHRTKFTKMIVERLKEVIDDEQELIKEHCHLDENGEPKKKDDGTRWDIKDLKAFSKDREELYKEEMIIEGGDVTGILKTVKKILDNLDKELSGEEADIYDYLMDQFDAYEEEKKEKAS